MDVMLSFILQLFIIRVLDSSLKFRSFSCFYNHVCCENKLFVLGFRFLVRVVFFFALSAVCKFH